MDIHGVIEASENIGCNDTLQEGAGNSVDPGYNADGPGLCGYASEASGLRDC